MPRNLPKFRHGVVSVEAALVIPLIFLSIIAGIEFVRLNIVRHTIRNASYEAARVAMIPGAQKQNAIETAEAVLRISGVRNAEIVVTPDPILEASSIVTVEISVPVASNSWGVTKFFGGSHLIAETSLRTERSPAFQAIAIKELTNPDPPPTEPPPTEPPVTEPPTTDPPPTVPPITEPPIIVPPTTQPPSPPPVLL